MSGPKRLVVDTSVALYLLRPTAPAGQDEAWRQAQRLAAIPNDEWTLCLPTPALGEVLAGVSPTQRADAAHVLSQMFEILDLDMDAAIVVGDIARAGMSNRRGPRQQVKVDIEIVACAIRWGAAGICTLDSDIAGIVERVGAALRAGRPSDFTPPQVALFDPE